MPRLRGLTTPTPAEQHGDAAEDRHEGAWLGHGNDAHIVHEQRAVASESEIRYFEQRVCAGGGEVVFQMVIRIHAADLGHEAGERGLAVDAEERRRIVAAA